MISPEQEIIAIDRTLKRYAEGRTRWPVEKRPKNWTTQIDAMLERRTDLKRLISAQ